MDIKELIEKKEALEDEISNLITYKVNVFVKEIGVPLKGIYISTTDIRGLTVDNNVILVSTNIELDI